MTRGRDNREGHEEREGLSRIQGQRFIGNGLKEQSTGRTVFGGVGGDSALHCLASKLAHEATGFRSGLPVQIGRQLPLWSAVLPHSLGRTTYPVTGSGKESVNTEAQRTRRGHIHRHGRCVLRGISAAALPLLLGAFYHGIWSSSRVRSRAAVDENEAIHSEESTPYRLFNHKQRPL